MPAPRQRVSLETYARAITAIEASILLGLRGRNSADLLVLQELFEDIAQRNLDICDAIVEARLSAPIPTEDRGAPANGDSAIFRSQLIPMSDGDDDAREKP